MTDIDNKLADEIYQVLLDYQCVFTQIENDRGAMPLVDLLSPGETIAEGREECGELAVEIAEAVSRHFAGLAEEWRPIETAPKDGSHIILWRRDIQAVGYYGAGCDDWVVVSLPACLFRHLGSRDTTPTHWMPLPASPKEVAGG